MGQSLYTHQKSVQFRLLDIPWASQSFSETSCWFAQTGSCLSGYHYAPMMGWSNYASFPSTFSPAVEATLRGMLPHHSSCLSRFLSLCIQVCGSPPFSLVHRPCTSAYRDGLVWWSRLHYLKLGCGQALLFCEYCMIMPLSFIHWFWTSLPTQDQPSGLLPHQPMETVPEVVILFSFG